MKETSEIKQFSVNAAKHLICAHNNASPDKTPALEGSKATLVASTITNVASTEVEAVASTDFVAVEVVYQGSATNTPLTAAVGKKTAQFEIKTKQFLNATAAAIQSAEGFELVDAANNKVELKSDTAGQFYFEIPKTATVGKSYYTLRSTTQQNISATISVNVSAATLNSVALKTTNGNTLPSALTAGANLALTLEGIFSDDKTINLSDKENQYTVESSSVGIRVDSNKKTILFSVPAAESNTFAPKVLTFTVKNNGVKVDDFTVQYYVNHKPQLDAQNLTFVRKIASDQAASATNILLIGGAAETVDTQRDLSCAKLTEAKFKVGNTDLTTVNLSNLIITVPKNSNFKVEGNYVCATDKAISNEEVTATIASREDPSVKAEKVFKVGTYYLTNKIAMVNELDAQVASYKITLSKATQSHTLKFKYLYSDNSLSNEVVPADNIVANLVAGEYFTFNQSKLQVSIANDTALNNLEAGATTSEKIVVKSRSEGDDFTTEIPVVFSKN